MNPVLSDLLVRAAFYIVLPFLVGYIVKKGFEYFAVLKTRDPNVYYQLEDLARKAVTAAEQMGLSGQLEKDAKFQYALDILQKWCDLQGVHIDVQLLKSFIEAAVLAQFPHDDPPTPTPATPSQ